MSDSIEEAKQEYDDAKEAVREQHARMREDLEFSNPADPQQWDSRARDVRDGRPCLTFDRTNQFIMQVVNDGRQNKPSIHVMPVDSGADKDVAEKLNGLIRHIEYVSRAGQAYDMALEHAARVGLGWIRIVPEIMRPETNEQEIRIKRVHDPLSILLDPNSTELDGSDAMYGFAETSMSHGAFKAAYPKCSLEGWDGDGGWFGEKFVRVAERFKVKETKQNNIILAESGAKMSEGDYWKMSQSVGFNAPVHDTFESKQRTVIWQKMNGAEILEETTFPSQWIPLVPVLGYELWVNGIRYVCGITRRLMDSQRGFNYAASAEIESIAMQPKAPFMAPWEAIEQHEDAWKRLDSGNPSYLPYNAQGPEGNPLPAPTRLNPPTFPAAMAQLSMNMSQNMEAAVGMHKANLGQQGNETSGRAITARQREGDTANYHYLDNRNSGIEQVGRIVVDMIPRIYDQQRQARIMGEDGGSDFVTVDPNMQGATRKEGTKVTAINVGTGSYDVRIKSGPGYTTIREEAAQNLVDISQGNPQLAAAMAPMLMKFRDMPEADKMARVAMSMLPPATQQAYGEQEGEELPPEVKAKLQAQEQQIQQLSQALENAAHEADEAESKKMIDTANMQIAAYKAETERLKVTAPAMDGNQIAALVQQLVQDMLGTDITPGGGENPLAPQPMEEAQEPQQPQEQTEGAPEGM